MNDPARRGPSPGDRRREPTGALAPVRRTARILADETLSERDLIRELVPALPAVWQFPEIAVARVTIGDHCEESASFRPTPWRQSASFTTPSGGRGEIEVRYLEEKPASFEGPFLAEERDLIDTLAEMISAGLQRRHDFRMLEEMNKSLAEQLASRRAGLSEATRALEAEREENRRRGAEIARHQERFRYLTRELALTEDRERQAIASDVHDQIGQALVFIKSKIRSLQGDAIFSGFDKNISAILSLLDNAIRSTRSLTSEISPPVLHELGLMPALEWLADQFRKKHGLDVAVIEQDSITGIGDDLRGMLFKFVRELLVNAFKHSEASRVVVKACAEDREIVIEVEDDGIGFDTVAFEAVAVEERGFGLFSIRERLALVGGHMTLESEPSVGTRVGLHVPRGVRSAE